MTIYETTGGVFDTPTAPGQKTVPVGSGTMAFQSCSAATFSYSFTGGSSSGLSGTINLRRVGPVPTGMHIVKPARGGGSGPRRVADPSRPRRRRVGFGRSRRSAGLRAARLRVTPFCRCQLEE